MNLQKQNIIIFARKQANGNVFYSTSVGKIDQDGNKKYAQMTVSFSKKAEKAILTLPWKTPEGKNPMILICAEDAWLTVWQPKNQEYPAVKLFINKLSEFDPETNPAKQDSKKPVSPDYLELKDDSRLPF